MRSDPKTGCGSIAADAGLRGPARCAATGFERKSARPVGSSMRVVVHQLRARIHAALAHRQKRVRGLDCRSERKQTIK
jgi:hypothetical protein